jgi:hypothetical protein
VETERNPLSKNESLQHAYNTKRGAAFGRLFLFKIPGCPIHDDGFIVDMGWESGF